MLAQRGSLAPKKQKARPVLGLATPSTETLLGSSGFDGLQLHRMSAICNKLVRERNAWSIAHHCRGMFTPDRRIGKDGAERMLRRNLAAMADGGVE